MKKILFSIIVFLFFITNLSAQDQEGLFSMGANIAYGGKKKLVGFGGRMQYGFTEHIRGSAEYNYFLDRRDWSEWQISMNAHYLLEASETVSLYPIAGLRMSRWTVDTGRSSGVLPQDRYKRSTSRLGANLGFGGQIELSNSLFLQLEPKWEITKHFSQFTGMVGLMYQF